MNSRRFISLIPLRTSASALVASESYGYQIFWFMSAYSSKSILPAGAGVTELIRCQQHKN
jgi:hypothetical protein